MTFKLIKKIAAFAEGRRLDEIEKIGSQVKDLTKLFSM